MSERTGYTAEEAALSDSLQADGLSPLHANILCKEPRAPEYARLRLEMLCNGAGYARGERLASIADKALDIVMRLEVELYEAREAAA